MVESACFWGASGRDGRNVPGNETKVLRPAPSQRRFIASWISSSSAKNPGGGHGGAAAIVLAICDVAVVLPFLLDRRNAAARASTVVHLWPVPFAWTVSPPFLERARRCGGGIAANPRGPFRRTGLRRSPWRRSSRRRPMLDLRSTKSFGAFDTSRRSPVRRSIAPRRSNFQRR